MRVYELRWYARSNGDGDAGCIVEWAGSKRAAQRRLSELKRANRVAETGPPSICPVILPMTKKGLLNWLNRRFEYDARESLP